MSVLCTQELDTLEDVVDTLQGPLRGNIRWMKKHGVVNIMDGRFVYKMMPKNKCGAEFWARVGQLLASGPPPYLIDCDMLSCILCAALIASGEDPNAKIRAIQVEDTAHIQVVSKRKILDPSVWLGMPVPPSLERAIFEMSFPGAVMA